MAVPALAPMDRPRHCHAPKLPGLGPPLEFLLLWANLDPGSKPTAAGDVLEPGSDLLAAEALKEPGSDPTAVKTLLE